MTADLVEHALLRAASGPWLPIPTRIIGVDPNTADVYTLAIALEAFGFRYPPNLPDKATGLAIVNAVEWFVDAKLIRVVPAKPLAERMRDLSTRLSRIADLGAVPALSRLALAFCTWHGCINMAKSLRAATATGMVYTDDVRTREYEDLKTTWTDEALRGNPWVRYGVSLARSLELSRGNVPNDESVPKDSPYWD